MEVPYLIERVNGSDGGPRREDRRSRKAFVPFCARSNRRSPLLRSRAEERGGKDVGTAERSADDNRVAESGALLSSRSASFSALHHDHRLVRNRAWKCLPRQPASDARAVPRRSDHADPRRRPYGCGDDSDTVRRPAADGRNVASRRGRRFAFVGSATHRIVSEGGRSASPAVLPRRTRHLGTRCSSGAFYRPSSGC